MVIFIIIQVGGKLLPLDSINLFFYLRVGIFHYYIFDDARFKHVGGDSIIGQNYHP